MADHLTDAEIAEFEALNASIDHASVWIDDAGDKHRHPDVREFLVALFNVAPRLLAAAREANALLQALECKTVEDALADIEHDKRLSLEAAEAIKKAGNWANNAWPSAYDRAVYLALKAENDALRAEVEAKQAKIDALMLEFCPDEMTPEQRKNWAQHQQSAPEEVERSIDEALNSGDGSYHP